MDQSGCIGYVAKSSIYICYTSIYVKFHRIQTKINLNVVNSFAAAWMQFSMKGGVVGILIQLQANLSSEIASRYDSPPQLQKIMMLFNLAAEMTEIGYTADGVYVPLRGLCLNDGTCSNPDASCFGGLCFDN